MTSSCSDKLEGEGVCERCDDSGYVERVNGGFWTGEGVSSTMTICDCICGDDVRREIAARQPLSQGSSNVIR